MIIQMLLFLSASISTLYQTTQSLFQNQKNNFNVKEKKKLSKKFLSSVKNQKIKVT